MAGSSGTERMSTESPPIIMTLPPHLQDGIPDGYELVPVDRITDEYEIVPWKQVKTLLNITVSQIDPGLLAGTYDVNKTQPNLIPFCFLILKVFI